MLSELAYSGFWYFILLAAIMIAWRIWGHKITDAVRRRDQRRRDAELQLLYDRANPNSHFRQSVEQINDDTPPVEAPSPTDQGFRWNGKSYPSRDEAEAARWMHVLREARDFYQDLDRSFGNRISGRKSRSTIDRNSNDAV